MTISWRRLKLDFQQVTERYGETAESIEEMKAEVRKDPEMWAAYFREMADAMDRGFDPGRSTFAQWVTLTPRGSGWLVEQKIRRELAEKVDDGGGAGAVPEPARQAPPAGARNPETKQRAAAPF